jgi:hypothetical protein
MCAVSVVYGMFQGFPDDWYTKDRIDLFKRMVTDARLLDVESGQPDCEDPEKAKLSSHIDELEKQLEEEEDSNAGQSDLRRDI